MKIALLTDGIYPYVIGGMQKHSFYLAKYFAKYKIQVDLYHTAIDENEAGALNCFSEEEKKYIHSILITFPKQDKFPGHYIREMYTYSGLIFNMLQQRPAPDFIYIQGLCGMKLLENKAALKCKTGVNFHGLEMFQIAAGLRSKAEQFLFKKPVLRSLKNADVVFSLGGKLTEILVAKGISKNKIIQIPIGIDEGWLRKEAPVSQPKTTFVFVGRNERRKGIKELTAVLQRMPDKNSFEFYFIGAIPKEQQLEQNNIHYSGSISDPEKIKTILNTADVLICPSYSEGMPTVIMEAMACGLAIIASNVGAVAEQVNEKNGLLIQPGNIGQLQKAMQLFIEMPSSELNALKKNSIEKVRQRFLWEDVIQTTITKIEEVIL